jgi:small subunit ribosomal protein S27Ae
MHIRINTITGTQFDLQDVSSISDISSQIEAQTGFSVENQTLLLNGKIVSEESLADGITLNVVFALEGGAKGKKKKKDTKKTKKKHHKKKVNLAVLKYYKLEGEKVVRLRQMCKVCPPGTFIAEHKDRLYCGRCRTAYDKVVESTKPKGKEEKGKGGKKKK